MVFFSAYTAPKFGVGRCIPAAFFWGHPRGDFSKPGKNVLGLSGSGARLERFGESAVLQHLRSNIIHTKPHVPKAAAAWLELLSFAPDTMQCR